MFEVPGSDIVSVIVTEDVVKNSREPEYVRKTVSSDAEYADESVERQRSSV